MAIVKEETGINPVHVSYMPAATTATAQEHKYRTLHPACETLHWLP